MKREYAAGKTERLQLRIEPETKQQAIDLFDSLGMSITDAVTIFIRQSIHAGKLPFNINTSAGSDEKSIV